MNTTGKRRQTSRSSRHHGNAIRFLASTPSRRPNLAIPASPWGMADVATVLFTKVLQFDPLNRNGPIAIVSSCRGARCMLLYAALYLTGYPEMTINQIKRFRAARLRTADHPEYHPGSGIEATTGPLGQGIGMSVGMAIAEAAMAARYGKDLVDHHTMSSARRMPDGGRQPRGDRSGGAS